MKSSLFKDVGTPFRPISKPLGIALSLLMWVLVLALWIYATSAGVVPAIFLPTPQDVALKSVEMALDGTLWQHTYSSLEVVLIGFVLSSVVAIPLGLVMGTYRVVQSFSGSLVNFIRYLPVTSLVPLSILWVGLGVQQRVSIIIFGIFFQQLVMFADAARSVPRDLVNAAYTLGTRRVETVFHIVLPATLPNIFDILRVTMGWAWTYVVAAELAAASSGLGYISMKAMRGFQVDVIFTAIAMIGILGLLTDQIFRAMRRILTPWAN